MIEKLQDMRGHLGRFWDGCRRFAAFLHPGNWLSSWWSTRHFGYFVQGLPALLAGAGLTVLAVHIVLTPKGQLAASYQYEARHALKAKNYPAAKRYYERLLLLKGEDQPDIVYGLALIAEGTGQHERARTIVEALAPPDRQGYAPAHFWQAQRLWNQGRRSPQALQAAEQHLHRTLQGQPDDIEAHALLGRLYVTTGRLDKAEIHLTQAAESRPDLWLPLARLHAHQGKNEHARAWGNRALGWFRSRAEADVDDHDARGSWAEAALFLEDFRGAVAILRPAGGPPPPRYHSALAVVYLTWSDFLKRDPRASLGDRLALVEQGLLYDPGNLGLLARLLELTNVKGPEAEKAAAAVRRMLAEGKAPASLHLVLGMDAWERGKIGDAQEHYELAYRLAPQMTAVAANLAVVLAESDPPELERALKLTDGLLDRWPGQPAFREVRGRILVKMGRWKEALVELEAILPKRPNSRDLRKALAEAYERLDMPELAAEHRRLAESKPPSEGRSGGAP